MTGADTGRMVGRVHRFPVRVYFVDTDTGGMVYHANYLAFAEKARTEMMRLIGFDHVDLRNRLGLTLGVRSAEIEYLRPARLDDLLEVRSTLEELAGASMRLRQEVWRGSDEIARIGIRLACIGTDGKPARIPDEVRGSVESLLTEEAL